MFDDLILTAPKKPGVYKMYNARGDLLYVGKAKNLLHRLRQYRNPDKLEYHKIVMMRQAAKVEWIETLNESDALVLEERLIKTEHPRYNILLKDDKMYPYLRLTKDKFPRLEKIREKVNSQRSTVNGTVDRGPSTVDLFGPFPYVSDMNDSIKLIQKICGVRTCANTVFSSHKKSKKPCLFYQTGGCVGCCVYPENYQSRVVMARKILRGKIRLVVADLKKKMTELANNQDYEGAARVRAEIQSLQTTAKGGKV